MKTRTHWRQSTAGRGSINGEQSDTQEHTHPGGGTQNREGQGMVNSRTQGNTHNLEEEHGMGRLNEWRTIITREHAHAVGGTHDKEGKRVASSQMHENVPTGGGT